MSSYTFTNEAKYKFRRGGSWIKVKLKISPFLHSLKVSITLRDDDEWLHEVLVAINSHNEHENMIHIYNKSYLKICTDDRVAFSYTTDEDSIFVETVLSKSLLRSIIETILAK